MCFLKAIKLFLKEIADFHSLFKKTSKAKNAIIFYAEHEGYYPYFEGLIEELISNHKRTLCYITSDGDDPILLKSLPQIRTFYLNKLLSLFMAFVDCKVFIMTMTDLNHFHIKRSINPVHYIYVFHSLVSTHMSYLDGAFDYYDSILCAGQYQIREIRKYEELRGLPAKKLIEAGYYRLERIYRAFQDYSLKKITSTKKGIVLIAPSWGKSNVLESCGLDLVDILLRTDFEVIVRPHPETVRRSPRLIGSFASKFGNNQNFTLEKSIANDDSLLKADVLISDCSGVALEYALGTERPVLFLDVPIKIRNQRYKELGIEPLEISLRSKIGVVISPTQIKNVPNIITELISQRMVYKERLAQLRQQYVYNFGHSSDIGSRYIINLALNKG